MTQKLPNIEIREFLKTGYDNSLFLLHNYNIMEHTYLFEKYPELEQVISLIKNQIQDIQKPPDQIVLDDYDLRELLKVSKRTTQNWRDTGMITFSKPGKIFYKLSSVLEMLEKYEVPAVDKNIKLRLKGIKNNNL